MSHYCRRSEHCATSVRVDDQHRVGGPTVRSDWLCDPCERHAHNAVTHLPEDYARLSLLIGKSHSAGGQNVTATRELPVPIRLDVEALMARMVDEVTAWAEPVAERLRVQWDTQTIKASRPGHALQRAANLLTGAFPVFLNLTDHTIPTWVDGHRTMDGWTDPHWSHDDLDGITGAIRLIELHRRAQRTLGVSRLIVHMPDPCHECQALALIMTSGSERVDCTACARWWTLDEHERLVSLEWSTDDEGPSSTVAQSAGHRTGQG